ncbi:hypothetical protein [Albidovulum sp.]|mgnify:FL=1|uniref:hypothetical protein n=1 Tax=Albidovulum sp. TaxID=1872424 RepID=UPI001DD83BEF|nr:hypothetical protein [Paracoccaceae bacterium]MCC0045779.1 hypothetical protein [Defluviimonas sp.]HPE26610.1 hypothetical protein [Albidovulum sp.]MCB2140310.1 hypothetical protein [Paracoccaceae bacterium]MCB2152281.1 hypothetical protein [Paracoccaceae bacterium]
MNRTDFIIATAIVLFLAFLLGWFASWLFHRLTRVTHAGMGELEQMAHELHDAEESRDRALSYLEDRELEMTRKLAQCEAELRAAMEGLRIARTEAEELRTYVERLNAGG